MSIKNKSSNDLEVWLPVTVRDRGAPSGGTATVEMPSIFFQEMRNGSFGSVGFLGAGEGDLEK